MLLMKPLILAVSRPRLRKHWMSLLPARKNALFRQNQTIGYSKVIAVVVFPVLNKNNFSKDQNLSSSSETEEFIKMLKADLKLPVIINDCCNYGLLVSIIKEYFGSD